MTSGNGVAPKHEPPTFLFWVVWNPASSYPPRRLHTRLKTALKEADRLATLNPGFAYHVLRADGFARVEAEPEQAGKP